MDCLPFRKLCKKTETASKLFDCLTAIFLKHSGITTGSHRVGFIRNGCGGLQYDFVRIAQQCQWCGAAIRVDSALGKNDPDGFVFL